MRAPSLPPDERRRTIMAATLPLLLEHGASVSTRQIATAAGIAEGTIFRVFASKAELIELTVAEAASPAAAIGDLAAIDATDAEGRVTAVIEVLQQHGRRAHELIRLLPPRAEDGRSHGHHASHGPSRAESGERLFRAIVDCLTPVTGAFRVSTTAAAASVMSQAFGSMFAPVPIPAERLASVVLYGISAERP